MGGKGKSRSAPPPPKGSKPAPTPQPKKRELPVDPEAEIKRLKKELKSEKARAESFRRYRDKEKEECLETHDALRKAEKDRDDARDKLKKLENPPTKQYMIEIGAQTHFRTTKEKAVAHAKELLDAGVWWVTLGTEK